MKKMRISGGTGRIGAARTLEFVRNGYHEFSTHNNKSNVSAIQRMSLILILIRLGVAFYSVSLKDSTTGSVS
jgi:hypothetical protein